MTLLLRTYQRDGLDALFRYWASGGGNGLLSYPTGAGKSLVAAALCQELLAQWPELRIAICTHTKELIQQDYQELLRLWPQAPAGIYSAGIGRRDHAARILVCGIQSVHHRTQLLGPIDLLIIDEAHLLGRSDASMYRKFIARMLELTPDMRVVGLTATPFRLDSGMLHHGEGKIFDDIVYECDIPSLIKDGYLCRLVSKATSAEISTSGVHIRGGDYIPSELEQAAMRGDLVERAAAEIVRYGRDRKAWLVFGSGIKHIVAIRDALRNLGIACDMVTGEMPKGQRDSTIEHFRNGYIQALCSVNVLSVGFNVPHVDLIALLRPSRSPGVFVQSAGRGFRIAPEKENCIVLDFAGLCREHGPIDAICPPRDKNARKEKEERVKVCPKCESYNAINATECCDCGYVFPVKETIRKPKHDVKPDADLPILSDAKPEWIAVTHVAYFRHEKPDGLPSLRVEYYCGLQSFSEWVTLEHLGYPGEKARVWWRCMRGNLPVPETVAEGLSRKDELARPTHVTVRRDGKWWRVSGYRVDGEEYDERLRWRRSVHNAASNAAA